MPPPFQTFSYEDRAVYTQTLIFPSSANWVCPPNVSTVQAECWGAGGGGGGGNAGANVNGGGGGGGAYTLGTASVTPGTSYTINVGAAGSAGGAGGGNGTAGGDTYFKDTSTILAKGGGAGLAGSPGNGGAGGSSASGVGTTLHSGGTGGNGNNAGTNQGGGGGGSAGNASDGGNGTNTGTAGTAGTGTIANGTAGGAGGSTNPGLAPTQTPGGGGGGGGANSAGAAGQGGFLRLTYTSTTPPPTSNTNLINAFNAVQYGNVSTDDGDYFIEYGSEFVMQEYKFKNPRGNNTDNITFTWRGRSTEDPRVSPILMQIYNTNSAAWETLATINTVPPDTDFSTTVTQSTNLANYYDSTNTVAFRSYQLVF